MFQVVDESRHIWRIYLEQGLFELATKHSSNQVIPCTFHKHSSNQVNLCTFHKHLSNQINLCTCHQTFSQPGKPMY